MMDNEKPPERSGETVQEATPNTGKSSDISRDRCPDVVQWYLHRAGRGSIGTLAVYSRSHIRSH